MQIFFQFFFKLFINFFYFLKKIEDFEDFFVQEFEKIIFFENLIVFLSTNYTNLHCS